MKQEQFFQRIEQEMAERFPEYDVTLRELNKCNGIAHNLMVRNPELEYCPSIKLDSFWDQYRNSENPDHAMTQVLSEMFQIVESAYIDAEQVGIAQKARDAIVNWKEHVQCSLVMKDGNEAFLADKPHKEFLDMAKIYSIRMDDLLEGSTSRITITNDQLNSMGCTLDELDAIAMSNTIRQDPASVQNITSILSKMMGITDEELTAELGEATFPMYVVSNESKQYGAAVIMYKDVMDQVCDILGTEKFFILPSSRHEVICIPESAGRDVESLREMVHQVNATEVPAEDILSESVYQYVKGQDIEICGSELMEEEVPEEAPVLSM